MPRPCLSTVHPRGTARTAALATVALFLGACSPSAAPPTDTSAAPPAADYPTGHIHGMSVDPATNEVLLATHDGLFDVSASPIIKIGPTIDLMGFTTTANGNFYASGHPGPGSNLPDPVGLIRSTDQGQTWEALSRQGESDFHALAATDVGVVGFDGELRTSPDGRSWKPAEEQFPAFNLAAGSRDSVVLATTEEGLQRSANGGSTWSAVPDAPLLMLTALSEGRAAGITPDGVIHTSSDGGLTWIEQGDVPGEAAAIATHAIDDENLRIWAATEDGVQVSSDNGLTFTNIRSHHQ